MFKFDKCSLSAFRAATATALKAGLSMPRHACPLDDKSQRGGKDIGEHDQVGPGKNQAFAKQISCIAPRLGAVLSFVRCILFRSESRPAWKLKGICPVRFNRSLLSELTIGGQS